MRHKISQGVVTPFSCEAKILLGPRQPLFFFDKWDMLDSLHLVSCWVLVDLCQKKNIGESQGLHGSGTQCWEELCSKLIAAFPKGCTCYSYKGGDKSIIPRGISERKLPPFASRQNHQSQRLKVTLASLAYCEPSSNPIHWNWVLPSLMGPDMTVTWVPVSSTAIQLGAFSFLKFLGVLRWVHMAWSPSIHHLFPLKQLWSGQRETEGWGSCRINKQDFAFTFTF